MANTKRIKFPKTIAVTVDPNGDGPISERLLAWKDVPSAEKGRVAVYKLFDEMETISVTKMRKQGETEWFEIE